MPRLLGQSSRAVHTKEGKMVVHGDVAPDIQCTAPRRRVLCARQRGRRPLINSRRQTPGGHQCTCLDFLAESFMAGDPNHGGGFVILKPAVNR